MRMRVALNDYARKRLRMAAMGLPADVDPFGAASPWLVPVDRLAAEAAAEGRGFDSLAHYDYLSLARHPEVLAAAKKAIDDHGVGVGASRLIGGERTIHRAFESEISDFLGTEAALLIGSGYLVNLSLVPHLVGAGDLVILDELAHSSALHGAKATRATIRTFRHGDMDHLESILAAERDAHGFCLVVGEGLYSMDGDAIDLPRLVELKRRWDAWLMIDEAHSIGVLGETGRGIAELHGIDASEIDILIGTLSKTFVSMGGFVCARAHVVDWLKYTLPGFVFSVGLSPVIVETARAALAILRREPERVARLRRVSRHFLETAHAAGFSTGDAIGVGIVPVIFDRPETTLVASRALAEAGIYAPPIMQSGVDPGASRIRFFLTADLDEGLSRRAIAVLKPVVSSRSV